MTKLFLNIQVLDRQKSQEVLPLRQGLRLHARVRHAHPHPQPELPVSGVNVEKLFFFLADAQRK
jgi:hypothetical protein